MGIVVPRSFNQKTWNAFIPSESPGRRPLNPPRRIRDDGKLVACMNAIGRWTWFDFVGSVPEDTAGAGVLFTRRRAGRSRSAGSVNLGSPNSEVVGPLSPGMGCVPIHRADWSPGAERTRACRFRPPLCDFVRLGAGGSRHRTARDRIVKDHPDYRDPGPPRSPNPRRARGRFTTPAGRAATPGFKSTHDRFG